MKRALQLAALALTATPAVTAAPQPESILEQVKARRAAMPSMNWRESLPTKTLDQGQVIEKDCGEVTYVDVLARMMGGAPPGPKEIIPSDLKRFEYQSAECKRYRAHQKKVQEQRFRQFEAERATKEAQTEYCRVPVDLRAKNPFGGKWASEGDYLKVKGPYSPSIALIPERIEPYVSEIPDCETALLWEYIDREATAMAHQIQTFSPYEVPSNGPVHVRGHQRCGSFGCTWVRPHTRSLPR